MKNQKYWIAVISKEHTMRGVNGNFIQVCHGKEAPLKRMNNEDWIIVYSPKFKMEGTEKLQSFTAIGQANDKDVYQFKMTENFEPFRRNMKFYKCKEISILPLIENLEFIKNKKSWGFPFRFGFFEINESDFNLIMSKMLANENGQ
ncbi:MAG TPA: EVE domain-containing protein [Bacteroidia bacterium]|nr:EVE domain-containing protein [Bacteroidia bacterium]